MYWKSQILACDILVSLCIHPDLPQDILLTCTSYQLSVWYFTLSVCRYTFSQITAQGVWGRSKIQKPYWQAYDHHAGSQTRYLQRQGESYNLCVRSLMNTNNFDTCICVLLYPDSCPKHSFFQSCLQPTISSTLIFADSDYLMTRFLFHHLSTSPSDAHSRKLLVRSFSNSM